MKAHLIWKCLVLGVVVVAVQACKSDSDNTANAGSTGSVSTTSSPGSGGAGDANKPVEIAFITNNASDYWTIAHKGTDKAMADMPGVKVDFEIPDDGTAAKQKEIIDDMISKGVQGIAISPVNPKDEIGLINDTSKKVMVFTQDSDAPTSDRACYVGSDNVAAGNMLGKELVKALPNGGKVMCFVGLKDPQNSVDRLKGINDAIKGTKIQIVDVRTDEGDRGKAVSNVSDALVSTPDLAGAVGIWSYNGPAILNAVKLAGKVGKVKIVCFDEEPDTLAGVKSGAITCTIVQNPYQFGIDAVTIMAKALRGDKTAIPASKSDFIPTRVIDQSSVDAFSADLKAKTGK
jgi:ribose transport system substrate-binding protein